MMNFYIIIGDCFYIIFIDRNISKIYNKELKKVVEETMYDYWMYVNQDRAISSLEDWLKPVHKRLLWSMYQMWLKSTWKTTKSARIVWDTVWKYHPHWDVWCYKASSKLTQSFNLNNPLIIGQWNFWGLFWFNSIAAARYTEMKLSWFSEDLLLKWLNENLPIVNFRDNYDGTLKEPEYFPSILPMSLLIPTFWIWLGISSDIPPHNLTEVANATIAAIRNKTFDATKYIKWPDFPMEGNEIIINEDVITDIYNKGEGSFKYRAKIWYDQKTHSLEINYLPYNVEFDTIYNELRNLVKWEKLETSGKNKGKVKALTYEKSLKHHVKKIENNSWQWSQKKGSKKK